MQASLTIVSDERLLGLAHAFGREFAVAAGVPEGECATLVGALDGALRFVCRRAYPGDPGGRIELTLAVAERGLRASLHDWGRPLTSAEGPDVLLDLGDAIEDLRLINLGAQGKRLTFVWRTSHAGDVASGVADPPAVAVAGVDADAHAGEIVGHHALLPSPDGPAPRPASRSSRRRTAGSACSGG
jgi:anti-sigma regulatory factor (Ser/Thr protein kinase)